MLSIPCHGNVACFDRRAVTMMICLSEGYVIRRRVGTYLPLRFSTTACRLRRRCVTRHPTRYRFIATPAHRAAAVARSFSTPLRYRSRLGLKFYLGAVFLADHFAFKFYRLNFAQNRDRAPSTDLQAARRAVCLLAADCARAPSRAGAMPIYTNTECLG